MVPRALQAVLVDVPRSVDTVVFPNYESLPERDDIADPFTQARRFCSRGSVPKRSDALQRSIHLCMLNRRCLRFCRSERHACLTLRKSAARWSVGSRSQYPCLCSLHGRSQPPRIAPHPSRRSASLESGARRCNVDRCLTGDWTENACHLICAPGAPADMGRPISTFSHAFPPHSLLPR